MLVTPDDDTVFATETHGISFEVAGDLSVQMFDGSTAVIPGLSAGVIHELSVVKILATGTTATGITAYF